MKKILFLVLVFFASIVIVNCSDKGGGGGEEPVTKNDKLIFMEEKGVQDVMTSNDEIFLGTSLIDTGEKKMLSPEMKNMTGLGLAPNGDFWFFTKFGLFRSNINSATARPEMVISAQELATDFMETAPQDVYRATISSHNIVFVKNSTDEKHYFAIWTCSITQHTPANDTRYHNNILRFDSKTGEISSLLPNLDTRHFYYFPIMTNLPYIKAADTKNNFYYMLAYNNEQTGHSRYLIKYDPNENKHYLMLSGSDSVYPVYFSSNEQIFYFTDQNIFEELVSGNCNQEHNDSVESGSAAVAECVNNRLKDLKIGIYKGKNEDITSYLSSTESISEFINHSFSYELFKELPANEIAGPLNAHSNYIRCNDNECGLENNLEGLIQYWTSARIFMTDAFLYYTLIEEVGQDHVIGTTLKRLNLSTNNSETIYDLGEFNFDSVFNVNNNSKELGPLVLFKSRKLNQQQNNNNQPYNVIFYLYSENKNKVFNLTLPEEYPYQEYLMELIDNRYAYSQGITYNGNYIFFNLMNDNSSIPYYIKTSDILNSESPDISKELRIQAVPNQNNAELQLLWKGYGLWVTNNSLIINQPFSANEEERAGKILTSEVGNSMSEQFFAATVSDHKPAGEVGFDLSADYASVFACGSGNPHAFYCENSRAMCEAGVCVEKIAKACAAHSDCSEGKICTNMRCQSMACQSVDDCPIGTACNYQTCSPLLNDDECASDAQCTGELKCLNDDGAGYNRCMAENVEDLECSANNECSQDNGAFVCISTGTCLPKVTRVTANYSEDGSKPITPTGFNYNVVLTWNKISDYQGNLINNYIIKISGGEDKIINSNSDDDSLDITQTIALSVAGNQSETTYKFKIIPVLGMELSNADINKIMKVASVRIGNLNHCTLEKGVDKEQVCPRNYVCKNNKCISTIKRGFRDLSR